MISTVVVRRGTDHDGWDGALVPEYSLMSVIPIVPKSVSTYSWEEGSFLGPCHRASKSLRRKSARNASSLVVLVMQCYERDGGGDSRIEAMSYSFEACIWEVSPSRTIEPCVHVISL